MKTKHALGTVIGALAFIGLTATVWVSNSANAQFAPRRTIYNDPRSTSAPQHIPVMAVVSLADQRVSIYGANGRLLQSPVSSGQTGYETPAGIFSIVQKKPEHHSNLYDDASMPFMERITWTGIALHAGVLPGYAASHGCVRLPLAFSEQLFGITKMGMRVIIVPEDILPAEISHPALFKPRPVRAEVAAMPTPTPRIARGYGRDELPISRIGAHAADNVLTPSPVAERYLSMLAALSTAKQAEVQRAAKLAAEAKQLAQRKAAEAAPAVAMLRAAEANLTRAQDQLKASERAVETAKTPEAVTNAETLKSKAAANVEDAGAKLETAKAQAQAKIDASNKAAADAKAAEVAKEDALEAAEEANRRLSPVSVFVSRKMRRYYVRQANLPIMEGPIAIRNPDDPIGTFVFTAMDFAGDNVEDVRWNVVSMYKKLSDIPAAPPPETKPAKQGFDQQPAPPPPAQKKRPTSAEGTPADVMGAKAALDRINMSAEAVERVASLMVPGSSLIISDEGPSVETGKDTDFIIVMANEPQGALKMRKREAPPRPKDELFGPTPFFFNWW